MQASLVVLGRGAMLAATSLLAAAAAAQDADIQLAPVTVGTTRSPLEPNLPATTESRTAEQLREQNFLNVEDALKYMPATTIRKRYIGDRNALIGGRSFSELQAPRALVYADGYLLSQFLGQFNAPRWNVVAPEEVSRVDEFYGPFSALYPGNSIGTTVVLTTRQPQKLEASARVQVFTQEVDDAGVSDSYSGHQESIWLGNKTGPWSYVISANRLKNTSQPMQYVTLQTPSTAPGTAVPVTGAHAAVDPSGRPWLLAGVAGGSSGVEDNTQEQVKLKLGYDFSSTLYGEVLYVHWRNEARRTGTSLLRDAAGNPVYAGLVSIDGVKYNIPANAFSPQNVEEEHGMLGLQLRTRNRTGWNASAIATLYDIGTDLTRSASVAPPAAYSGGAGTYADNGGTGWKTIDLQTSYTPEKDEAHTLVFGYHSNRYELRSRSFQTADWRHGGPQGVLSGFVGKTHVQAWFAQDTWKFAQKWLTTVGMRYEEWRAQDGRRETATASIGYPRRKDAAWSPKASLSWLPAGDTVVKASVGKGVRFPTVSELFQGQVVGNTLVNNDPNLKPERAWSKELSVEQGFDAGMTNGFVRVSLFEDDVRDTILSQTNVLVFPNVTNIQNIGRVRTRGVELSGNATDVGVRGLDLTANVTWARAVTLENDNNPATIGKNWVRVPRLRANLVATWRADERWSHSLAARYSGRQYNTLDNSDVNPNAYGGTSTYTVWDWKTNFRLTRQIDASFGINNLTDKTYYAFHPYPSRTFIGELHASF